MYDMANEETREMVDSILAQIKEKETITLHQVLVLLRVALNGVNSKTDLSDEDILTIKAIRQELKGL
jgi:hypothetical protein